MLSLVLCLMAIPANGVAQKHTPQSSQQITLSFAPLVKKAKPAVVNIYTKKKVKVRSLSLFGNDAIFQHFFGNNNPFGSMTKQRVENSLGSGVIIDPKGLIITNYHVIKGSEEITVILSDNREFAATIRLVDERTDLAILAIENTTDYFPYLEFANSDALEVGDLVLAIGNPFGVGQTVTSGIISALSRTTVGVSDYQFFIQTDAAINPGNSGGALLTTEGKIAGINTAIYSRSGGSNGIGFATPANMAAYIVKSAKTGSNRVIRPWLGVTMQKVTQDIANSLGLPKPSGALISKIYQRGAAAKAGLKVGDVITHIEQYEISDEHALRFRIATYPLNKIVPITVYREDSILNLSIIMEPAPEIPPRNQRTLQGNHPFDGAVVANISPAVSEEMRLAYYESGVVIIDMIQNSLATRVGLQQGDIIAAINAETIESTQQLATLVNAIANNPAILSWKLRILRDGRLVNYTIQK